MEIQVIIVLHLYHDTQMIVTFLITLLVGDPYGKNTKIIKRMSLYIVITCCLVRNVNLILANISFGMILFIQFIPPVTYMVSLILTRIWIFS